MQDILRQFKAEFFRALAHPTRIAILEHLRDGELSAGELIERLGLEQANASQHLAVMRAKNILLSRKSADPTTFFNHPISITRTMISSRSCSRAGFQPFSCF